MKSMSIRLSVVVLVILLPGIPRSESQSIDLDKQLGAENALLVESQMGIYNDPELTAYVNSVGQRLVESLENPQFDYQFKIVDDPVPNAFALPGGYVYVSRGILALINTEDELAGVIGHEIIHVSQRHSIKQLRKSIFPRLLEIPGRIVGNVINEDLGNLVNAPIETSNALLFASYGRGHESESDALGIILAGKAGYNPYALAAILNRLSVTIEILTDEKERKSYFDDHPYTPDRVRNILKKAAKVDWESRNKLDPEFPSTLDGLLIGDNPAKGIFQDSIFLHPDLNFAINFPKDWERENNPSTVGAVHPDRKAALYLGIEDPEKSPKELGETFIHEIQRENKVRPDRAEPYVLNGNEGYLVTITDKSGKEDMYVHLLWLKMGAFNFKLIGLAPKKYQNDLVRSASSLRTLSPNERESVMKTLLKVAEVRKGETLQSFNQRTSNSLSEELTILLNGIEIEGPLVEGQKIKVFTSQAY